MKKVFKIVLILVLGIPLVALLAFQAYLSWPKLFPKYPVGSCVEDTQVHRVHEIIGSDDWLKGSGVRTRIIKRGDAVPGAYAVGSESQIFIDDAFIKVVECPMPESVEPEKVYGDSMSEEDNAIFEDASVPNPELSEIVGQDGKPLSEAPPKK